MFQFHGIEMELMHNNSSIRRRALPSPMMEVDMPVSLFATKSQKEERSALQLYIDELQELNARMRAVHREFDSVSDESLIDGIIYELLSIGNRQSFLLNAIKELGGEKVRQETLPSGA